MIKKIENGADWVGWVGLAIAAIGFGVMCVGTVLLLTIETLVFLFTGVGFHNEPVASWLINPVGVWALAALIIGAWITATGYGTRELAKWWRLR